MTVPGRERRGRGKVALAMTPMIDIVFNLVIFFLLMPVLDAGEGYLPTNLPPAGRIDGPAPRVEALRIDLRQPRDETAGVSVSLNREPVSTFAQLRGRLREARSRLSRDDRREAAVMISPDGGVWHLHVVAAFDAAVAAGFKDIRFTVPQ